MTNPELDNYVPQDFGPVILTQHHGALVSVRQELKGKHRDHCLCYSCDNFKPELRVGNCPIANLIYAVCVAQSVVTPVWECPKFEPKSTEELKPINDPENGQNLCGACD